jgi:aryl sulfotransferase
MKRAVLLASYPKSGNTWMRAVLTSVMHGGAAVDINHMLVRNCADRQLCARYLGINLSDLTFAEIEALRSRALEFSAREGSRRHFLKVHDAWLPSLHAGAFPIPEDLIESVIYIVRDPRDVAASFARHLGKSVDETIGRMSRPRFRLAYHPRGLGWQIPQLMSTWSVHVSSWLDGFAGRLHVVRYEDMQSDPAGAFATVFRSIGLRVSPSVLRSAISAAAFDVLQTQERNGGFIERPRSCEFFFGTGTARSWHTKLTAEQAERIVADHGHVMRRLGYETDMPRTTRPPEPNTRDYATFL